jgi:hypothetical protein
MRTVDLTPVENLAMCAGVGDFETTACVVAQAAILDALSKGQSLNGPTDKLECACPVLRSLAIAANDVPKWASDEERTTALRGIIPALLDSRVGAVAISKRAAVVATFAEEAAKSTASRSTDPSAKYAVEYAVKSAKAAQYAEFASRAAKYVAESAEYAAESAEYAAKAAESAEYAAKAAEYAEYAAKAAESARSAAKYDLKTELLKVFWQCEAIKD